MKEKSDKINETCKRRCFAVALAGCIVATTAAVTVARVFTVAGVLNAAAVVLCLSCCPCCHFYGMVTLCVTMIRFATAASAKHRPTRRIGDWLCDSGKSKRRDATAHINASTFS